jgi:hypothetical protein
MATFAQISEVRIRIDDPPGYQAFIEVANAAALPATPAPYTAYKLTDTGAYMATELESGATSADYTRLDVRVSDSRIGAWIDADSVDVAECKSYAAIATRLGNELKLKSTKGGAETAEWQTLKDTYTYYKGLSDDCKDRNKTTSGNSTGRYGTSVQPEIAGGEI